jgi:hypothetical protein
MIQGLFSQVLCKKTSKVTKIGTSWPAAGKNSEIEAQNTVHRTLFACSGYTETPEPPLTENKHFHILRT